MTSSDDLQFPLDTNFFLFLDPPENFNALTACPENPSLLASEGVHNEIVESISVSAATNDIYHSTLIENPPTDQETLTTNSSFCPEMVPQHQSFHHQDDYSRSFNAVENFPGMVQPPCTFRNGQRETNDVHPSTLIENPHTDQETLTRNSSFVPEMILQHQSFHYQDHYSRSFNAVEKFPGMSTDVQHGFVNQSYQQPSLSQTIPNFSNEPYVSTLKMGSNAQQVGRTNAPTNHNPMFQDHRIHPSLFQEERYDDDLLLAKLKHRHENDQMHRPEPSNVPKPPYVSESYSPFAQTYQSDPYAFNFQTPSSLKTTYTRRPRGRPRKNLISIPSVPTTQTPLTSLRHYGTQDKGKEHITAIPSTNPTLYNQYRNSYTNIMTPQSGVLRQRSCNDQLENESSSAKTRRTMGTFQEKSIADSSTYSFWQNENTRSGAGYAAKHHHDKRSIQNAAYDPLYAAYGMPLDPHLRFF
ncbi:unnamed protein product [Brassica napus]|uniref:(rape) hypothetical protein n=1 Tax=Brassica napus TaxID=3708 RepID=A0A816M602_BRANA|nr:unnamed protein product [Brassica napus]